MNIWKRYIINWKNSKIKNIWIAAMNSILYVYFILYPFHNSTEHTCRTNRIDKLTNFSAYAYSLNVVDENNLIQLIFFPQRKVHSYKMDFEFKNFSAHRNDISFHAMNFV